MTMNLAWLAALLKPRDVAFHVNCASEEVIDTPGVLALLALGEIDQYNHLTQPAPFGPQGAEAPWSPPTQSEADFLAFTQKAISIGQLDEGASGLRDLCASGNLEDSAALTAATLIAALAFAESDDYASSLGAIDFALEEVHDDMPAASLCRAALLIQRGLRLSDSGQSDGLLEARSAHDLLRSTEPDHIPSFKLSLGVSWDSRTTVRDITSYLMDSCIEALTLSPLQSAPTPDFDYYSWQDRVRGTPDHISLLNDRRLASGYGLFVAAMYKEHTRGTGSREVVFGAVDRGESQLFAAQFGDEISGHRSSRQSRLYLAEYRLLASKSDQIEVGYFADTLRLLRHSGFPDQLKSALNVIRAEGPLAALRGDAQAICRQRLQSALLREPEFRVLHAAADLLPRETAVHALMAVLESLRSGVPAGVPGRWISRSARLEPAWLAASALATAIGECDQVAQEILRFVINEREEDAALDIGLTRAMRDLDWDLVEATTKTDWANWAMDGSRTHEDVREQAVASIGSGVPVVRDPASPSLGDIAQALNIHINGGHFPAGWLTPAMNVVRGQLAQIAAMATSGSFSGGGISVADVAVGLALYLGAEDLWSDIADFLANPAVQRADTASALDRLAVAATEVPQSVVEKLAESKASLLFDTSDAFGPTVDPYPAALRCLARLKIVGPDELLLLCTRLAGDGGPTGRHEAARVVTMACRDADPAAWLRVTALHQSWDALPEVRAEAARALALLSHLPSGEPELFEDRLMSLLGEDGLLVPILALRGLTDLGSPLGARVLAGIETLAASHPSRNVRRLARSLLNTPAASET